ncbi:thiamine biosynthesis protein ApbE [Providencia vermicola]|uniref:Thiamine biosynthesis protein ApbE n=4 Tax=Providencia TaxID=586 RepID=A0AAI9HWW1_PROST|nr:MULTISPECIES: thiamine biosynthesis protein ApbE [Providencia]ELR5045920.1 thiamine biosynthesis protein ApbE [Providencia rettgeri]ELR5034023.1 thiamine biosynthesis protein ApbE [Providencia stuartii]ELR5119611.1 thiamine biosynthesis protein ApbE [Providencia stuartii]ELR5141355.1 thiamine biosynthesis protein ApbE [Providencia stuartii]ELR5290713.1 thiamine biosynthesis protein ApbE [Providencia stuartii]
MLGCSTATKQVSDQNGCTIQIDPPEGKLPAKIEQATGTSPVCKSIEKSIDKAI